MKNKVMTPVYYTIPFPSMRGREEVERSETTEWGHSSPSLLRKGGELE